MLLIPRYTQLSKYAMIAAHEVNAARESALSKRDNNKLRCMRVSMICFFRSGFNIYIIFISALAKKGLGLQKSTLFIHPSIPLNSKTH